MAAMQLMNAPIPGQSLTQDPSSRGPWERPPQFNTVNSALDHLHKTVTSKKFIQAYDKLLEEDRKFYVDTLVVGMLQEGFLNGLWTVDTMMLLVEPLTVLMVWTAAQLNRSPSFSTDTGYEDRTGFDEMMSFVDDDEVPQPEPQMEPEDEPSAPPATAENPAAVPQSPLVGGM